MKIYFLPLLMVVVLGFGCSKRDPSVPKPYIHFFNNSPEAKALRGNPGRAVALADFGTAGPGLKVLSYLRYGGPILGKINGNHVVSKKFFKKLIRTKGIYLKKGQAPQLIAVARTPGNNSGYSLTGLVEWMIESGVIITAPHQGSVVYRTKTTSTHLNGHQIENRYKVYSIMYTNSRSVTEHRFKIRIKVDTGEIWLYPSE